MDSVPNADPDYNLVQLTNQSPNRNDKNSDTGVVFVGISKAIDLIWHDSFVTSSTLLVTPSTLSGHSSVRKIQVMFN
jgi:hypothetical protein